MLGLLLFIVSLGFGDDPIGRKLRLIMNVHKESNGHWGETVEYWGLASFR